MCGIAGANDRWLRQQGLDPAAAMQLALARLRWRGQDGGRVVRIGAWHLTCARLAITQQHSNQPVVQRGGRFAAVLNGAITNARELWRELLPGAQDRPEPPNDAWLPLLAVAQGRRELLAQLRGHHAFAVIDADTDTVVLAQDRFGEKPLLAWHDQGELVGFASTPGARAALGAHAAMSTNQLASWFRFGFADWGEVPQPATLPAFPSPHPPLRERLSAAVARCLDVSVPTAIALSGGLDSSCVAACVPAERRARTAGYQFCATGNDTGERNSARAVAAHLGLPFRAVDAGIEVLDALAPLTAMAGRPLGDPSVLAVHALARAARHDGVRVLLGGEGADELLFGYRRYRALSRLPRWPLLARFAPRWQQSYVARWLRACGAKQPATALLAVTPPGLADVLAPEIAHHPWWNDAAPPPGSVNHDCATADAARDADLRGYLRWDLLPKVDVATLAAGVEARCPFLEGDFGACPADQPLGKQALRVAFADHLPRAPLALRKRGFSLPLDRWWRGKLPWLDLLREPRTLQRAHLRGELVAGLLDRHRRGAANLGHALYLLVAMELHLRAREHLEAVPGDPGGGLVTQVVGQPKG